VGVKLPKSGATRRVALGPALLDALRQWRQTQPPGTAHILEDAAGWVTPQTLTRAFGAFVRAAGLPPLTLHGLRHTSATLLLQSGVPVRTVSDRLGHTTPAVTATIYSHVLESSRRHAADVLDAAIRQEVSPGTIPKPGA
jgi:integrase